MGYKMKQNASAGEVHVSVEGNNYTIHKEQVGTIPLTHEEVLDLFHMLSFVLRKHTK